MPALIGLIGSMVARFLAVSALKWAATKAILITICVVVLPSVLYRLFTRITQEMITYAQSKASTGLDGLNGDTVMELTGMAGWIANQIGLPACLSIFLSALVLRYGLYLIKA
jgi:hypothetical protein